MNENSKSQQYNSPSNANLIIKSGSKEKSIHTYLNRILDLFLNNSVVEIKAYGNLLILT